MRRNCNYIQFAYGRYSRLLRTVTGSMYHLLLESKPGMSVLFRTELGSNAWTGPDGSGSRAGPATLGPRPRMAVLCITKGKSPIMG